MKSIWVHWTDRDRDCTAIYTSKSLTFCKITFIKKLWLQLGVLWHRSIKTWSTSIHASMEYGMVTKISEKTFRGIIKIEKSITMPKKYLSKQGFVISEAKTHHKGGRAASTAKKLQRRSQRDKGKSKTSRGRSSKRNHSSSKLFEVLKHKDWRKRTRKRQKRRLCAKWERKDTIFVLNLLSKCKTLPIR